MEDLGGLMGSIVKCLTGMGKVSAQFVGFWVPRAIFSVEMLGGFTPVTQAATFLFGQQGQIPPPLLSSFV